MMAVLMQSFKRSGVNLMTSALFMELSSKTIGPQNVAWVGFWC